MTKPYFLNHAFLRSCCAGVLVLGLSACGSIGDSKSKFPTSKYGPASPVVVDHGKPVPKGGGRYKVGSPYKIAGRWYHPEEDEDYRKEGMASWYGPTFHGRKTANGEVFDRNALSAAHPTLPMPSYVRVTNLSNNRSLIVRVNDRGPFSNNRIIDLSEKTATMLDFKHKGLEKVRVEYVGKAPLHGDDTEFLLASYSPNGPAQLPTTAFAQATQTPPAGAAYGLNRPTQVAQAPQTATLATRYVQTTQAPVPQVPVSVAAYQQPVQVATAYTPPVQAAATPQTSRLIQLGVFGDINNAQRLAQSMEGFGQVVMEPIATETAPLYRVRILVPHTHIEHALNQAQLAGVSNPRIVAH